MRIDRHQRQQCGARGGHKCSADAARCRLTRTYARTHKHTHTYAHTHHTRTRTRTSTHPPVLYSPTDSSWNTCVGARGRSAAVRNWSRAPHCGHTLSAARSGAERERESRLSEYVRACASLAGGARAAGAAGRAPLSRERCIRVPALQCTSLAPLLRTRNAHTLSCRLRRRHEQQRAQQRGHRAQWGALCAHDGTMS